MIGKQRRPRVYPTPHHKANCWAPLGCVWFKLLLVFSVGIVPRSLAYVRSCIEHVWHFLGRRESGYPSVRRSGNLRSLTRCYVLKVSLLPLLTTTILRWEVPYLDAVGKESWKGCLLKNGHNETLVFCNFPERPRCIVILESFATKLTTAVQIA